MRKQDGQVHCNLLNSFQISARRNVAAPEKEGARLKLADISEDPSSNSCINMGDRSAQPPFSEQCWKPNCGQIEVLNQWRPGESRK